MGLVRERYADFGPTLAAEKLSALHGLSVSRETLRQWMMADGVRADRRTRAKPLHQPRGRRECLGELVQIDGSRHWWFEERGPPCTLLVYIDDATSRLMHLQFVLSETAFDYFRATRTYMAAHGRPVAFYSDKHSIFRAAKADVAGGCVITQFGRALQKGRTRCMRGFKSFASAERFCRGYDELRNFLRPCTRHNQYVSASRRRLLHLRRASRVLAILEAA